MDALRQTKTQAKTQPLPAVVNRTGGEASENHCGPIKDSGDRDTFPTGATRDTQNGKPTYGLLPVYALSRVARHFANGRTKYRP